MPKKHDNKEEPKAEKTKTEDTYEDFSDNLNEFTKKISKYIELLKTAIRLTKKLIHADKLTVQISLGTGDAAYTAVCVGILWGAVYNAVGLIGQLVTMEMPVININPDYEKAAFKSYIKCIISTCIAYIIFIGIIILFKYVRKDKEV